MIQCPDCGVANRWVKPPRAYPRRYFTGGTGSDDLQAAITLAGTAVVTWLFLLGIGEFASHNDWAYDPREPLVFVMQIVGYLLYAGVLGLFLAIAFGHWNGLALLVASIIAAVGMTAWFEFIEPLLVRFADLVTFQTEPSRMPRLPPRWERPAAIAAAGAVVACAFRSVVLTAVRLRIARLQRARVFVRKTQPWRAKHVQ